MNKEKHVIVLNGHRYDAKTGENLSRPGVFAQASKPVRRAPAKTKTEASHHATTHRPAPRSARQAGGHVKAHAPKAARTLMRQAVKKPAPSLKRRIKVQGRLDGHVEPLQIKAEPRIPARHRAIAKGRQIHLINHFSPNLFTTVTVTELKPEPPQRLVSDRPIVGGDVVPRPTMQSAFAPRKPRTTAELLEYAIRFADAPSEPEERQHHARKHVLRRRAHAVAR